MANSQAATARNEWVEGVLEAFRNNETFEWRAAAGKWYRAGFQPRPDGNKLCQIVDVSTEKRLEQECRQLANVGTRETPLARGLAHIGHELRTPLNAILGFSDLIRSEAIGPLGHPSYVEYANDIYNSGQVLLTAVDRIALLVKLEAGLIRPQSANVPSRSLVLSAIETVAAVAATAEVEVQTLVSPDSPALFIDHNLLAATLSHLLENAIAASPVGGVVQITCTFDPHEGLTFEVRDKGNGIPADQLAAIREPFVRLDASNPKFTAGVGMGLPLADLMAGLLNCSIALDSGPDTGTSAGLLVPSERVVIQ